MSKHIDVMDMLGFMGVDIIDEEIYYEENGDTRVTLSIESTIGNGEIPINLWLGIEDILYAETTDWEISTKNYTIKFSTED